MFVRNRSFAVQPLTGIGNLCRGVEAAADSLSNHLASGLCGAAANRRALGVLLSTSNADAFLIEEGTCGGCY